MDSRFFTKFADVFEGDSYISLVKNNVSGNPLGQTIRSIRGYSGSGGGGGSSNVRDYIEDDGCKGICMK